jgi:hypothetical protein
VHPPPFPEGWAEFTIMMECTPESGHFQSICTLLSEVTPILEAFIFIFYDIQVVYIYNLQIYIGLGVESIFITFFPL